ncbi:hypothetical protein E2562_036760 [Oryza meyeriana var. granulata]|uniref:Uncharacterized protein n=1 Tax=Oryza meyeriana var. granulata TaxID=110450 RepID=A0A6G1DSV7_9ORYZ|nr:hypothetical protein E2562_036760 [Oryza meyeriana var. granulata]
MSNAKGSKMLQLVNYRMGVTIQDGRQMASARAEGRSASSSSAARRLSPWPSRARRPPDESRAKASGGAGGLAGPGVGRASWRGVPSGALLQTQPGLAGPVLGVGGPARGMMQPQISRQMMPTSRGAGGRVPAGAAPSAAWAGAAGVPRRRPLPMPMQFQRPPVAPPPAFPGGAPPFTAIHEGTATYGLSKTWYAWSTATSEARDAHHQCSGQE